MDDKRALDGVRVDEGVAGVERDRVGVVPEQPALALVEGQLDLGAGGGERRGRFVDDGPRHLALARDGTVLGSVGDLFLDRPWPFDPCGWGDLNVGPSP